MKRFLFLLFFVSALFCCLDSAAQSHEQQYKQLFRSYLTHSGSMASFDGIMDQLFEIMAPNLNDEQRKLIRERGYDELIDVAAPIYMEMISLEDLRAFDKFYNTPAGKRIAEVQPLLLSRSMQVGEEWGARLQRIIQEYMIEWNE